MKILLVETQVENAIAAAKAFAAHDLIVVSNFGQALEALGKSTRIDYPKEANAETEKALQKAGTGHRFMRFEPDSGVPVFGYRYIEDGENVTGYNKEWEVSPKEISITKEIAARHQKDLFDLVLTDAMLPKGDYGHTAYTGEPPASCREAAPLGAVIAFHALARKVKKVGILIAHKWHDDPNVSALDDLPWFAGINVKVIHDTAMMTKSASDVMVRDWTRILEEVIVG